MTGQPSVLQIRKRKLVSYLTTRFLLILVPLWIVLSFATMGGYPNVSVTSWVVTGVILLAGFAFVILWPTLHANRLRYSLDGLTLRIDEGVLFRKEKSIPLDRVTDLTLVQGPLMWMFGIWAIHVQTAGSAQQRPEGVLHAPAEPQQARDLIMEVRDRAAGAAADSG